MRRTLRHRLLVLYGVWHRPRQSTHPLYAALRLRTAGERTAFAATAAAGALVIAGTLTASTPAGTTSDRADAATEHVVVSHRIGSALSQVAAGGPHRPFTVEMRTPKGRVVLTDPGTGVDDIPAVALQAYQRAAAVLADADPTCGLSWTLLAAIGRVESDHGRYGGATIGPDGMTHPRIIGVSLDGSGPAARVPDTDDGALDGDLRWDRAVGPMQFLPSTWVAAGVDGDGDGRRSPDDIYDAALAAGVYLCAGSAQLDSPTGVRSALMRYNPSRPYAALVTAYEHRYAAGDFTVSGLPRPVGSLSATATLDEGVMAPLVRAAHVPRLQGGATVVTVVTGTTTPQAVATGTRTPDSVGGNPAVETTAADPSPSPSSSSSPSTDSGASSSPTSTPTSDPTPEAPSTSAAPPAESAPPSPSEPAPSDQPSTSPSPSDQPSESPSSSATAGTSPELSSPSTSPSGETSTSTAPGPSSTSSP